MMIYIFVSLIFLGGGGAQYMDESVVIVPPAFSVLSVEQNTTTQQIVVQLRVGGGSKHVPLLYMSKQSWSTDNPGQIDVNENPCQPTFDGPEREDKTCCLEEFVGAYQTATDIEDRFRDNTGVCNEQGVSLVTSPSNSAQVFQNIHFPTPLIESQLLQNPTPGVTYESRIVEETSN